VARVLIPVSGPRLAALSGRSGGLVRPAVRMYPQVRGLFRIEPPKCVHMLDATREVPELPE
jgi:hypothetical protein